MTWTQATVMRAVKAALEPARKMGLHVTGYKVTFVQGVPAVDVTLAGESAHAQPVNTGEGYDIKVVAQRVRGRHERRA